MPRKRRLSSLSLFTIRFISVASRRCTHCRPRSDLLLFFVAHHRIIASSSAYISRSIDAANARRAVRMFQDVTLAAKMALRSEFRKGNRQARPEFQHRAPRPPPDCLLLGARDHGPRARWNRPKRARLHHHHDVPVTRDITASNRHRSVKSGECEMYNNRHGGSR